MRIAVCYSGQPRDIKECHNRHIEILHKWAGNDSTIDFFIHLWFEDIQNDGKAFWEPYPKRGKWDSGIKNWIDQNIKPKKIQLEKPRVFTSGVLEPDKRCPHPVNNTMSMFHSIYHANDLKRNFEKENNFIYDCVFRMRTDTHFINDIGYKEQYDISSVNIMDDCVHAEYAINDHFAFGNSVIMDVYSDAYYFLETLVEKGSIMNPECLLGFNLKDRGIKTAKHSKPDEWNFRLWRDR
jgi:hypothetical protein